MIITPIINLPMSQGGEEHKLDRSTGEAKTYRWLASRG